MTKVGTHESARITLAVFITCCLALRLYNSSTLSRLIVVVIPAKHSDPVLSTTVLFRTTIQARKPL